VENVKCGKMQISLPDILEKYLPKNVEQIIEQHFFVQL